MLSNDVAYQSRVFNAAQRLSGCNCQKPRLVKGVSSYRVVRTLRGYRVVRANVSGLAGLGVVEPIAMIPVSDPRAVAAAVKLFARARGRTVAGIGDSSQVQSAATMAATGAKIGSIVPGIGTVIGAVVGAVAGWIMGQSKPVRPSAAEKAKCNTMLTEYMGYAAQSPNTPLPMEWPQLLDLNWCFYAIYGGETNLKDPRFFNPGFENGIRPIAIEIVKKIYETPVGGVVNISSFSFQVNKKSLNFKGFSFVNPVFTDIKTLSEKYFEQVILEFCQQFAGKGASGCVPQQARTEYRRLLYDLLAWAARTTLPNISEADLKAASQVAATVGSSAKDVVSAVESIINRSVVKGETVALLSPTAATPTEPARPPPIPTSALTPLLPTPAAPVTPVAPLYTPPTTAPMPTVSTSVPGTTPAASAPTSSAALVPVAAGLGTGLPTWAMIAAGLFGFAVLLPQKSGAKRRKRRK